ASGGLRVGVDSPAAARGQRTQSRDVARGMDQFESRVGGWRRLPDVHAIPDARRLETRSNGYQAIRPLRMPGAGIVPEKRLRIGESGRQTRTSSSPLPATIAELAATLGVRAGFRPAACAASPPASRPRAAARRG